jgi:hypothetical protein
MLGFQGPAQPSPALGDALNAGYSPPGSASGGPVSLLKFMADQMRD